MGPTGLGCLFSELASSRGPADRQVDGQVINRFHRTHVHFLHPATGGQQVSHLPPGTQPVSLLGAAAVRQLLDDVTNSKAAATRRKVLLLHLQPAEGAHGKTLDRWRGRHVEGETGGEGDRWRGRQTVG